MVMFFVGALARSRVTHELEMNIYLNEVED